MYKDERRGRGYGGRGPGGRGLGHQGRGGQRRYNDKDQEGMDEERYGGRGPGGQGQGHWGRGGQRRYNDRDQEGMDEERYGGYRGNRGRGRDRGKDNRDRDRDRGRHGGSGRGHRGFEEDQRGERPEGSAGGGGGRPPPGLRGKEIGLWYARKGKARAEEREKEQRPVVKMVHHQEQNIRQLLKDIRSSRDCPPQPSRSGAELPPESEEMEWHEEDKKFKKELYGASNMNVKMEGGASNLISTYDDVSDENSENEQDLDIKTETEMSNLKVKTEQDSSGVTIKTEYERADVESDVIEISDDETDEMPAITEMMKFNVEEDYMIEDNNEVIVIPDSPDRDTHDLDQKFFEDYTNKQQNPDYIHMHKFRAKLPSYTDRRKIVNTIHANQVVVLSGETGCGKTTQVPQYILDDFIEQGQGSQCRIICTQPRRISAISVAERVAAERAETCGNGNSVGYMIRLDNKLPRKDGSILYCTTGILLKVLEGDSLLHKATHIILDEIHERDLLSDFLIIILRDILQKRPDLKLVLMSATLNAEAFSKYFFDCPMINVPGFTYPVKEYLLEDVIEMLRYEVPDKMLKKRPRNRKQWVKAEEEEEMREAWLRNLEGGAKNMKRYSRGTLEALKRMDMTKIDLGLITQLIKYIVTSKDDGAILVFLPGWTDISELHKMLSRDTFFSPSFYKLIPLHSMMPTMNQREVFDRPPHGVRKIVIATNIAETSITIDDVVYVIDCGRIKVKGYSPENNLATLDAEMVSRANARQRRGRAGRVQPGECYHLYTSLQESLMLDYLPPEILRTRLEELCLQIKYLKLGEILPFVKKAMQPPSLAALKSAIVNLQNLNALDSRENLLPLGKHLARMPLDPHTGKMILFGAMFGCLDPILTIAASLNFKDPFFIPLGKEALADKARLNLSQGSCSDHLLLVKAFKCWERAKQRGTNRQLCYDYFMSESTLFMLQKMRRQLAEVLFELGFIRSKNPGQEPANRNSDNPALVKAIVCAGLYPNVAKIKSLPKKFRNMKFLDKDGERCELHPKSVAKDVHSPGTQWVVFHKKMKTTAVFVYDCSLVSPYSLLFFGGDVKLIREDNVNLVCVDDWIKFKASSDTVSLVKELRQELDYVLDKKITDSKGSDWGENSKEGAILRAIIDLVTTEDAFSNFESRQTIMKKS